jgi:DNA-binding IclR family transcriptional regulator
MPVKVPAKEKILKVFKENPGGPLTPLSIARKTRLNKNSVRRVVQEMVEDGELRREKRGTYSLPSAK